MGVSGALSLEARSSTASVYAEYDCCVRNPSAREVETCGSLGPVSLVYWESSRPLRGSVSKQNRGTVENNHMRVFFLFCFLFSFLSPSLP